MLAASNMKILTLNTKKACSPAATKDAGSGSASTTATTLKPPPVTTNAANEKSSDSFVKGSCSGGGGDTSVSSDASNSNGRNSIITATNHKINKREFNHKHNNCKTKCEHRNNNAQQQQHQQQRYHHNNNNNNVYNNHNGNRLKKQHYNNNNNNNNSNNHNNNYNCNNNNNNNNYNNNNNNNSHSNSNYNKTYNNLNNNYNNNNNNNHSLLNRKKYYQHRQQQQQQSHAQYLQAQAIQQNTLAITTPPQPLASAITTTTTITTTTINTKPFCSNNMNYNNRNISNNIRINTTSNTNHLTIECTCPSLSSSFSSNSSSSTASNDSHCCQLQQQQQQQQLSNISTTVATISTSTATTALVSGSQSSCVSCWKKLPKLSQPPPIPNWANFKSITATSTITNLQESVASTITPTSKCNTNKQSTSKTTTTTALTLSSSKSIISTVSSIPINTTATTSSSTVLPSLATKKKSFWKNSNIIVSGDSGSGIVGGAVIGNACNPKQSPKDSNEKVRHVLEKNQIINTGSSSSSNSNTSTCINSSSNSKISFSKNNNESKYSNAATEVNAVAANTTSSQQKQISKQQTQGTEKKAMTTSLMGNSGGSVSIKNSASNSNTSITTSKNAASSPKQQKESFDKKNDAKPMLKTLSNSNCKIDKNTTDNNNSPLGGDIAENRNISTATTSSTTTSTTKTSTSPLSPNSYSLDFLHSVGVKMTGVAMRSSQGTPNTYGGNQSSVNSPAHNNYSYGSMSSNQRQHRYGVYGANNNSASSGSGHHHHQQHQHHYHHQPTQLTIASFLQKDLLGDTVFANVNNVGGSSANSSNAANTRNTNNSNNDHQQQRQQQQTNHNQRYHQNYYISPYHQQHQHQHQRQPMIMPHLNYVGSGGVATGTGSSSYGGGDLPRLVSNGSDNSTGGGAIGGNGGQRSYAYAAYHNLANEVSSGGIKNNPVQQLPPRQMRSYATTLNSANNKKSYASSTASSCSTSSSKSISSNSSNASNRQLPNKSTTNQESNKCSSNLNLPIETLPIKCSGISSSQRGGNHRGHHHYHHNQHGHHHHHQHHQHHHGGSGGHHHNQHTIMNAPNMIQHQKYYNLTYVSTDGSAPLSGTTTKGCSPAPPQTSPATLSTVASHNCHSPKTIDSNSSGPVAMLMSFNTNPVQYQRFANAQQLAVHHQQPQQFHQYQQQQQQQPNFFNKKLMTPLTLTMPSMSPSPTPTGITIGNQQTAIHFSSSLHNIICCSQLDEATTAAAAAAATTSSVGNDYDSDTSSIHSCTQSKYTSLRPKSSSSSSSSWASATPSGLSPNHICRQSHNTACCSTSTPLSSPLDYGGGGIGTPQTLSNIHAAQHMAQHQNSTFKSNSDTNCQHLQQLYRNGSEGGNVITLLNLPTQSSNTLIDDDFHNQHHLYFTSTSSDHLNPNALPSRVNNGFDYWTPSHHGNPILYHLSSTQVPILLPPKATSSTSSCCGSSPAPSPSGEGSITNDMQQQHQQQLQHNNVNEQFTPLVIGGNNYANETEATATGSVLSCNSISNSLPDSGCVHDIDVSSISEGSNHNKDSPHVMAHQQQQSLLIAQQTYQSSSSSTSSLSSSSASTLTSAARAQESARGGVVGVGCVCVESKSNNTRSNNQMQLHSTLLSSNSGLTNGPQQQPTTYLYSHQQQQNLAVPGIPTNNLLFSNHQTHHMRALNNSPSIAQSVHEFFTHTPPDRFLARAHLVETKEAPLTLLTNSKWDILSLGIWEKFREAQQKEETFKQKMRLWRFLYLFIKNAYPRYGLYLVGSTISGFGADTSDVDMCLVSRSVSNIDPRVEAVCNLTVLRDCLIKSGEFENFNLIEAKVPILRFRDRLHQLEVDLNFNNCVGIKNTHLLYCYSQLDWRLRPLVLVTKLWAQYHNINNAKNMTISSYSLVLMVIHYLQYAVNPPVLPCLHEIFPEKFPLLRATNDIGYVDMNESMGPYETKNTQTLGELFLYFLRYYSCFDYAQYAISVRTGGLLPINVCRTAKSPKNDIHQWKVLCIEEPFDLTNTARSVYDYETFEHVKAVFTTSWHILEETLNLAAIFSPITLPSSSSSMATNMSSTFENTNNSINTTALESTVCAVGNEPADEDVKDIRKPIYMKISNDGENYEEYISNDIMVDTIEIDDSSNGNKDKTNNNTDSNATISKSVKKSSKAKELKSTLTPQQQQQQQQLTKRYGGKEFQKPLQIQSLYSASNGVTPSTNPSSCYKSTTKNRNNNNANPTAASTATIS